MALCVNTKIQRYRAISVTRREGSQTFHRSININKHKKKTTKYILFWNLSHELWKKRVLVSSCSPSSLLVELKSVALCDVAVECVDNCANLCNCFEFGCGSRPFHRSVMFFNFTIIRACCCRMPWTINSPLGSCTSTAPPKARVLHNHRCLLEAAGIEAHIFGRPPEIGKIRPSYSKLTCWSVPGASPEALLLDPIIYHHLT